MSGREYQDYIRLKYAATINDDVLPEDMDPSYEMQYVDISNVDSEGNIHDLVTYRFEDAPSRARRRVKHGDTIISTVRTYLQAIALIVDPPENMVVSTGFAVVRPLTGVLQPNYCKYALRESGFISEVIGRSVGISYPAINSWDLSDICIRVPSVDNQQAIADFLDYETARLDTMVSAKEQQLSLLAEKRRSFITQAVIHGLNPNVPLRDSGVPWIGDIPAHWEIVRLRWLSYGIEQGWSPQADDRKPPIDEWGVIKLSAVNAGVFDDTNTKALPLDADVPKNLEIKQGDLLITRANTPGLVADVCYVQKTRSKLILSDLVYRLQIVEEYISPKFLNFFLISSIGRVQIQMDARGTSPSMVKINQEHIRDWQILVPPILEQNSIIAEVEIETRKIDALRRTTERTIALLKERRAALIAAAVTGQLPIGMK